ncbi:hypothetical protein IQ07DRAFT_340010 [Pyrenochaeta sp. DS3sAY3a]|nr:hypothetical protein IQ07DRAFT_340010 [Pyrenochaeta sp. DS3sAY3a]
MEKRNLRKRGSRPQGGARPSAARIQPSYMATLPTPKRPRTNQVAAINHIDNMEADNGLEPFDVTKFADKGWPVQSVMDIKGKGKLQKAKVRWEDTKVPVTALKALEYLGTFEVYKRQAIIQNNESMMIYTWPDAWVPLRNIDPGLVDDYRQSNTSPVVSTIPISANSPLEVGEVSGSTLGVDSVLNEADGHIVGADVAEKSSEVDGNQTPRLENSDRGMDGHSNAISEISSVPVETGASTTQDMIEGQPRASVEAILSCREALAEAPALKASRRASAAPQFRKRGVDTRSSVPLP